MQFDWFTIIAQAINFLILLGLLYKFLYKPVSREMENRRNNIEKSFQEADSLKSEYESKLHELEKKENEFEEQKKSELKKAKETADEKRQEMLKNVEDEADEKRKQIEESYANERRKLEEKLTGIIGDYVFKISAKALKDLSGQKLESSIYDRFINKLKEALDNKEREIFNAMNNSKNGGVVYTANELNEKNRKEIETLLVEESRMKSIDFRKDKKMICGVRFYVKDYEMSWNIADYIDDMKEDFFEDIKEYKK